MLSALTTAFKNNLDFDQLLLDRNFWRGLKHRFNLQTIKSFIDPSKIVAPVQDNPVSMDPPVFKAKFHSGQKDPTKNIPDFSALYSWRIGRFWFDYLTGLPSPALPEPEQHVTPLADDGRYFTNHMVRARHDLSWSKSLLAEFNIKTKLARRTTDIDSTYAKKNPHLLGYYTWGRHTITMIQQSKYEDLYLSIDDPYHTYLHEVGHAISDILFRLLNIHPENLQVFADAYAEDIKKIAASDKSIFSDAGNSVIKYLTFEDGGARSDKDNALTECWAELFAAKMVRTYWILSDWQKSKTESLLQHFQNSALIAGQIIDAVEYQWTREIEPHLLPYPS